MKLLHHALVDYELPLLKAIAARRAMRLETLDQREAVEQLTEVLLSPVATAITVDDLSPAERNALDFLIRHEGQVEGARFSREFGEIRSMGPGRLDRERPWESPVSPAEGLWYRGLLFKTFQVGQQGSREWVYIPKDLLSLLQPDRSHQPATAVGLDQFIADEPDIILPSDSYLPENVFRLLVHLQTTSVRVQNQGQLLPKDKVLLQELLLPPLNSNDMPADQLSFLLHLSQRANLLTVTHSRLRPNRDPVKVWLQSSRAQQIYQLQHIWRTDHTWNDLWHVPTLVPQATGWENSPMLARAKILDFLTQSGVTAGSWLSVEAFIAAVKQSIPDFQRPGGDYESWYIQDRQGNFLMGFEHWEQVEGALIRYLLTTILPTLGVVDLGLNAGSQQIERVRLTVFGQSFLAGQPAQLPPPSRSQHFRVQEFQIRVPARANLYDRFQLARFAQLEDFEQEQARYRVTQASVQRALRNGVTPDQITAFLARVTNNQAPLRLVEAIRNWGARYGSVQLEQATLLHLKSPQLATEIRQHPELAPLLGENLTPTTILVPSRNLAQVRRTLIKLGYLEESISSDP
ncbi:MAG TPA: helicase-associated domain-containing protein [Anaerolineae bacterium]|nr:helicase-associated domain-containing protein [Anaerolineae bacterium]